jgi:catalytic LigB subunit of aromatic ring-opening dioxygenase
MARIVIGIGTSHSPLLPLTAEQWLERAADDRRNTRLNVSDGRFLTYAQLESEVQGRYADQATLENFTQQWDRCQQALDRLSTELQAARPDVVIVVGDDQEELFRRTNIPAIAIYYGAQIVMRPLESMDVPRWLLATGVGRGYAMDLPHHHPGAPVLGRFLIEQLTDAGFDLGAVSAFHDPNEEGLGHAYGFVIQRLLGGRPVPLIPVLLNTYYPPNTPAPARCYQLGQALRRAVERSTDDLRVAIIASGGLSHFVCDEQLDRRILAAIQAGEADVLRSIPRAALNAGSSEIANWVTVAGAMETRACKWSEYVPVRRTPAGTGIGLAFLVWQ